MYGQTARHRREMTLCDVNLNTCGLKQIFPDQTIRRSPSELEDGGPCASAETTLLNDFLQEFRTGF